MGASPEHSMRHGLMTHHPDIFCFFEYCDPQGNSYVCIYNDSRVVAHIRRRLFTFAFHAKAKAMLNLNALHFDLDPSGEFGLQASFRIKLFSEVPFYSVIENQGSLGSKRPM
jgi:hypothetical protein